MSLRELLKVILRDAHQGDDATAEGVLEGLPVLVIDIHDPSAISLVDIAASELMNLPNACPSGDPKGNGGCLPVLPKVAHCPLLESLQVVLSERLTSALGTFGN
ncbi:hypothetical protein D3C76_1521740 [compost metagenome]